jgi:RNA polymerase sigma-70 factor (ECF subfamily)
LDQQSHADTDAALRDALVLEGKTPVEESEENDLTEQIVKGIERLSQRDRGILMLRNIQHASYSEMARALGITIGTVKSRLARARERLRTLVKAEIGHEIPFLRKTS